MKQRTFMLLVALGALLLASGCKSLFPASSSTVNSRWKTYQEVSRSFAKIKPRETDTATLKILGFEPSVSPNVKVLTYLEIVPMFLPNSGIQKSDLPEPVQEFINTHENGTAYLVDLNNTHSKRYGNIFLDIFSFKRKTHVSGWKFHGLILVKNDVVIYKLASGEPNVSTDEKKVRPLGPLQELDGAFIGVVGKVE
jgi:hypothetical protein